MTKQILLPRGKEYGVIYADPPWKYKKRETGGSLQSGAAQKYPVLSLEEICSMPVENCLAADNAVLFLWVTAPILWEWDNGVTASQIFPAWGFEYRTVISWVKLGRLGLGHWFRGNVEFLMFGVRGKVKAFKCEQKNYFTAPTLKHSQKPGHARRLIEYATRNMPNADKRIELFARDRVPGWSAWGNELG